MVICLERCADLHTAQLMLLPLTVSCFSKIQIGFTFLVPAYMGSPGKGPLNGCVCVSAVAVTVSYTVIHCTYVKWPFLTKTTLQYLYFRQLKGTEVNTKLTF